ncbi:hypothetical protein MNAB215_1201 [Mycobacterium numidiamassiliense]|uniref:RES domain-containing protein n=1 Tax=Mycobacterium numidiamassiliense TaxID=1841861 RepID=A0A2U3P5J0_9MYCO|nr:hypothetical protein MNAB215_1201 [Mycobacterium numidiamassiliense]
MQCSTDVVREVHRIGYAPAPWDWTPWEHAQGGRFHGRWDDPDGNWRALYVGDCALACYLEVLAPFRPDPVLAQQLAEILSDDEDYFPTTNPGELPYVWCEPRLSCSAMLSGYFAVPGHHKTLPTLRKRFLQLAKRHGCKDLDAGAIRHASRCAARGDIGVDLHPPRTGRRISRRSRVPVSPWRSVHTLGALRARSRTPISLADKRSRDP